MAAYIGKEGVANVGSIGEGTRRYREGLMHALMDREGLDALAFMSGTYIKFASNWSLDVSLYERPTLFIFPRNGSPFAILHELSTNSFRYSVDTDSVWVSDVIFYSEHPRVRNRLPLSIQWNDAVVERLEIAGLQHARIGTDSQELARLGRTFLGWPEVQRILPRLRLENVADKCAEMLIVKHPEELALIREAGSLANWGQEHWVSQARGGRGTMQVDMQLVALITEEASRRYPPGVDVTVSCRTLSGPGSWFGDVPGDTVEVGRSLVTRISVGLNSLSAVSERTRIFGAPSRSQIRLFEATRHASEEALGAIGVGVPISRVRSAVEAVFERYGVSDLAIGNSASGSGVLKKQEMVMINPGLYDPASGGYRNSDVVIVDSRPELISTTERDLKSQVFR